MCDPPGSRDVRPRTACLFPEYGGLPLLSLFGQLRRHPWSPAPLHPHRRRLRPRPHCRLIAARPAHDLCQAVRVLRHLRRAPPPRNPDHSALCWKIWVPFLTSSSTTTSPASPSRPRLLRLLQQQQALAPTSPSSAPATAMEAFSAGPPRRRRLVVHPPLHVRYWQHRCVPIVPDAFPSLANSGMCRLMA